MLWKTIIPINDYRNQIINILFQNEKYSFLFLRIRRICINIVKAKKFAFVGIFFIKMNYYIPIHEEVKGVFKIEFTKRTNHGTICLNILHALNYM